MKYFVVVPNLKPQVIIFFEFIKELSEAHKYRIGRRWYTKKIVKYKARENGVYFEIHIYSLIKRESGYKFIRPPINGEIFDSFSKAARYLIVRLFK